MEIHSRNQKTKGYNTILTGVAIALVVPVVIFLFYWYIKFYPTIPLTDLITQRLNFKTLMQIIAVCALPVPIIFYFFSKHNYYQTCKGMIAVIFLLLVVTLITKFV
ncbi:MAG: hypothetical protein IIU11_08480 [Bacteroidales bacterium]|jgi:hypothetical protein|nr:hypothetical protein [Bacteroidales bacterium]MBR6278831.1 hypothetical protein [Bacteroidales bacterium]